LRGRSRPTGADKVIIDFSLSPDRAKMAITRAARESDVVMVKGIRAP
jgi:hypothetical protein